MTSDAVEWCQGTAAGGGCSTRVWTRRERQRDGSAAGGHPRFLKDTYPAILVPSPAPTSCRKRTGAGLREHPMRDPAKLGPREGRGRSRRGSREGRVRGIARRMRPDGGPRGAAAGKVFQKKCGWPPAGLPSACRSRHPQESPVRPAPADTQNTVSRMVNPAAGSRHAWRATKSAMNRFSFRGPGDRARSRGSARLGTAVGRGSVARFGGSGYVRGL
jgi:hypothetical protein